MAEDRSNSLVIVAIPEENDPVWRVSSEKVPHMTVLYLGEHEPGPDTAKISSFLEHVVQTNLYRFGASVDRRGTLGERDADVLFFEKNSLDPVKAARGYLLKN